MTFRKRFFLTTILLCGCAPRSSYVGHVSETLNSGIGFNFSQTPDSVWKGIIRINSQWVEISGDFSMAHRNADSLWTINITGPFGVSIFKARKSHDSLEIHWKDENDVWLEYKDWETASGEPLIPFGELFFSLCVGHAPGEIVEERNENYFLIFEDILYALTEPADGSAAVALVEMDGEEYFFILKPAGRDHLIETVFRSDSLEAVFIFR
ncbi:hypothetical protein JW890_03125 [candidate division WOR-3 bacterium]|nr:hypothetical protein [candidate division WOR-3 bacterium]